MTLTEPVTDLCALFAPRGVAVVGASSNPAKLGAVMGRSLAGFPGPVALVNSRDTDAAMHSSVAAAAQDGPVDLAVLCVPAAATATALAEAAAAGAGAAVVCGGGFAEAGGDGERHQRDLADVVARTGIRVLGPNTSGFVVPSRGLTASFVPGAADLEPGRVAVIAASGGVNHALAFLLAEAGHGISLAVGLGNAVDVSAPDVLEHVARDGSTAAVALHVESVADGPRLLAAVRRCTETRPVVALVVGRHDVASFAQSHTGALATSWRTTRAALRQAGAVVVDDERELVDAVAALATIRLPTAASSPGVGVVTAQAGPGLLLLDDLLGRRALVPELVPRTRSALTELLPPLTHQANPVDTGRPGPGFGRVLAVVAADPAVDLVAAYALHEPAALDLLSAVDDSGTAGRLVAGVGGAGADVARVRRDLVERGVPTAADPRGVANMVGALLADAVRPRRPGDPATTSGPVAGPGPWDEDRAKTLVAELGVATPPRRACDDRAAAHRALAELRNHIHGPVAVKLLDATVLHKTEIGGVRLGVRTVAELDAALDAMGGDRWLVESMAADGVDLVVGARRDPVFGPVVLVGLGGTMAEALADVALRVAPVDPVDAAGMVDELACRELLDGWRGGPVLDRAALGDLVTRLGQLLLDNPALDDVEINPLRLTADGLVALDAVVTRGDRDGQPDR